VTPVVPRPPSFPSGARGAYKGPMAGQDDKRKQSLYFPVGMLQEFQHEATRQDRSLSWVIQQAWRLARSRIATIPGTNDPGPPAA